MHVANQAYNDAASGGAIYSAAGPRAGASLTAMNTFSSLLHSWCNSGDSLCAYGDGTRTYDMPDAHTNYFDVYSAPAGAWIRMQCGIEGTATATATSTAPIATATGSTCTAGTVADGVSGNYAGLCSYACSYGYCPEGVCTCTATGTPATVPADLGTDGCPAAGLDDSYAGLCSFSEFPSLL